MYIYTHTYLRCKAVDIGLVKLGERGMQLLDGNLFAKPICFPHLIFFWKEKKEKEERNKTKCEIEKSPKARYNMKM